MYSNWDLHDIDNIYRCIKDGQDIDVYGDGTVKKAKARTTTQSSQPSVKTPSPWGSMEVPRLAAIEVGLFH